MEEKHLSTTEMETKFLARGLLDKYRDVLRDRALLFALSGELGAGKTVFAKGVGEHLGIKRPIRSPGFVLVAEYSYSCPADPSTPLREHLANSPTSEVGISNTSEVSPWRGGEVGGFSSVGRLFHVDLWRIEDEAEARALGIERMIRPGNIILIEWAQKIPNLIRELEGRGDLEVVKLEFVHKSEKEREIKISK